MIYKLIKKFYNEEIEDFCEESPKAMPSIEELKAAVYVNEQPGV